MEERPIKVLVVEDVPEDARKVREALSRVASVQFELTHVERLSETLRRLDEGYFDVVLLDLFLPDSKGLETFSKVQRQAEKVAVIVLTGLDDEKLALRAVQEGAQDYLIKQRVNANVLVRVLCYTIERYRMIAQLRALSLVDVLTGLYNRRGFLTLAQQQMKLANRTKKGMCLLFVDIDNMKWINDTLGHHEGDRALIDTASILKNTFRETDIIARIGGDEFAVMLIDSPKDSIQILTTSLHKNANAQNVKQICPYKLSLSVGMAYYDPECGCSVDELLIRADSSMYDQKRSRPHSKFQV